LPQVGELLIEFDIGEEARAMMAGIDAFMTANVTPEMKAKFHYSWEGWVPELHWQLAETGLLFLSSPELGGRGVGACAKAAARRALDKHSYRNTGAGVAEMVGLTISQAGSEELKQDVLSKIIAAISQLVAQVQHARVLAPKLVIGASVQAPSLSWGHSSRNRWA
jgi:3-oxochol-4-en-24-oyl-CoA dehydrogenase